MIDNKLPALRIGELIAEKPIIQGGMGVGISLSNLASAVAEEGGIGIISATGVGMFEPDYSTDTRSANARALRKEIHHARQKTSGIIGVNILVALTDFDALFKVSIEEKVDIVIFGAGLPLKVPEIAFSDNTDMKKSKLVPIVSSGRATELIFHYWDKKYRHIPDAVIVEGPLAGGHLGFKKEHLDEPSYSLENILPAVLNVVKRYALKYEKEIPVIAAGGIYTGQDIKKFLSLGVDGVQMGTRFVTTNECDAPKEIKQAYLDCRKEDIIIIDSPVGLPGRAIKNQYLAEVADGKKHPFNCPWKCLKTCDYTTASYCISHALIKAKKGHLKNGFTFAGSNAWRSDIIISVRKLFEQLSLEYSAAFC